MEGKAPTSRDEDAHATKATESVEPATLAGTTGRLAPGTTVGRYVVIDELGHGGMGVVFRAYDPELDRTVALKLHRAGADTSVRERLLREAKALARLSHPHVIAIHDVGVFQDEVFLAMEYLAGKNVRRWLREGPRTQAEIIATFLAAGAGLAAAHRAGLVHRDFKPDNVVVGDDGRVCVLDFGLARAAAPSGAMADGARRPPRPGAPGPDRVAALATPNPMAPATPPPTQTPTPTSGTGELDAPLTAHGAILGTPGYMSPEQHEGGGDSPSSDQWAFCVALHEALYGVRPFQGRTQQEVSQAINGNRIAEPPADARVPKRLRALILRGLARDPAARFPSMDALLVELRRDPRARRRRLVGAGVALALAAAAVPITLRIQAQQSQVCAGAERKLDGIWDGGRKRAVRAAFAATGVPYQGSAYRGVEQVFDAYAGAWVTMHTETCRATRVAGEQSEELLDRRMQCLSLRLGELAAKVDLFAAADAKVVEKALLAAAALTDLDGCANAAALLSALPPPADAIARTRVAELRHDTARAKALLEAGKLAEGLALAEPAAAAAGAAGYRPAEAEVLYILGLLRSSSGDYPGAERALRDAFGAAFASHHDEIAAQALAKLVAVVGDHLARFADADEIGHLAEAALERLGGRDSLRWSLLLSQGTVAYRRGHYQEALTRHQQALELLDRIAPTHPGIATALASLAEDHRALARFDEAEALYQRALKLRTDLFGAVHPLVATTFINLGNLVADRGRHDEAIAYYGRGLEICAQSLPADHPYVAATLNNRADELRILGRYDEALVDQRRAAELWERRLGKDHPEMAVAHHNLGNLHRAKGQLADALAAYDRALAIRAATLTEAHPNYAVTLGARGETLRALGRLDEARADQRRALALAEQALGPTHPELLTILLGLARTYLDAGAAAQAQPLLERAQAIATEHPGDGTPLAEVRFELARTAWRTPGARARALPLAREARATWLAQGARGAATVAVIDAWLAAPR